MVSKIALIGLLGLFIAGPSVRGADRWKRVFEDSCRQDWTANWFLDGLKSSVRNTPEGMVLTSGVVTDGDAAHAVLWTKADFRGEIRVEYDFTRLDSVTAHPAVCILYLQATGTGEGPYEKDLFSWAKLREVPKMSLYYNNLNCYHVSYACTGGKDYNYVRARRYPAHGSFDADTRMLPSYDNVDLFKPGETWHLRFEKVGAQLTFTAVRVGTDDSHTWTWNTAGFPPISDGRVGLRQMLGRQSRFANFQVFLKE